MKRRVIKILAAVLVMIVLGLGGLGYYVQTHTFMERAGQRASGMASEMLGVQVDVGDIQVKSLHDPYIHNLAIYDKRAELMPGLKKSPGVAYHLFFCSAPADTVKRSCCEVLLPVKQRPGRQLEYSGSRVDKQQRSEISRQDPW